MYVDLVLPPPLAAPWCFPSVLGVGVFYRAGQRCGSSLSIQMSRERILSARGQPHAGSSILAISGARAPREQKLRASLGQQGVGSFSDPPLRGTSHAVVQYRFKAKRPRECEVARF